MMATEEDIAWFKSTFHPIPKPQLPDDSVEYYVYHLPSPAPAVIDEAAETRARLLEVQRTAADLTKELLKDYIWQRESFRLEISKDDGKKPCFKDIICPHPPNQVLIAKCRGHLAPRTHQLRRFYRRRVGDRIYPPRVDEAPQRYLGQGGRQRWRVPAHRGGGHAPCVAGARGGR